MKSLHPMESQTKKKPWSYKNKKLQPVTYCKTCKRWHFFDAGGHLPGAAHDKFVKKLDGNKQKRGHHSVTSAQVAESD